MKNGEAEGRREGQILAEPVAGLRLRASDCGFRFVSPELHARWLDSVNRGIPGIRENQSTKESLSAYLYSAVAPSFVWFWLSPVRISDLRNRSCPPRMARLH